MNADAKLYHIALAADVEAARESPGGFLASAYRAASLDEEGFVHCCDREQLAGVVSRYYRGQDALLLLVIDPDALQATDVRENTVGGSELFPHVYGPIDPRAIVDVREFGLASDERLALAARPTERDA